jgi:hypothetical protein
LIIAGPAEEAWVRLQPETLEQAAALERSAAQGEWTNGRGAAVIIQLRALAERLRHPVRISEEHEAPAIPPPRLVVVQRGQTTLTEGLRAIAGSTIPVIWDRRDRDRRAVTGSVLSDRRERIADVPRPRRGESSLFMRRRRRRSGPLGITPGHGPQSATSQHPPVRCAPRAACATVVWEPVRGVCRPVAPETGSR